MLVTSLHTIALFFANVDQAAHSRRRTDSDHRLADDDCCKQGWFCCSFDRQLNPVHDGGTSTFVRPICTRELMLKSLFALSVACIVSTSFVAADGPANTLTDEEKAAGWMLLFDGTSTDQWRNYQKEGISDGWKVADGVLTRAAKGAGDIITRQKFGSFEIVLDYRISKGGNSGLMYHVTEDGKTPWQTGPETQIQDNVDGHDPQKAGWLYQFYPAEKDATRPAGEWNTLRVLITPERCVHTMNGEKYVEYVKGSDDWNAKLAASKFSKFPQFGVATTGHICLQDHGNEVSFRNIKIREFK